MIYYIISRGRGESFSSIKSFTSFLYRFFHFKRLPGGSWRLARPKEIKNLTAFNGIEVKRAPAEEREREEHSSAELQRKSK